MRELYSVLKTGESYLSDRGDADFAADAEILLLHCSGLKREDIIFNRHLLLGEEVCTAYEALLERRAGSEPTAYITGQAQFLDNIFCVGKGVLIPRPETEQLTDMCINLIRQNGYGCVYDLCAGSGCIGLSIAKAVPFCRVYLFELSDCASFYLEKNLERLCLSNCEIIRADVLNGPLSSLPAPGFIVSNPPYIPTCELPGLDKPVLSEPLMALNGGVDGLDFYRVICQKWLPRIAPGGMFAFECDPGQGEAIASFAGTSFNCEIIDDFYSNERFLIGKKSIGVL